ncbi:leukemia inhibitory factor receptor isoform 1-T1 [Anomaloglossus baeobatrachus]|uniref:leukemia inhibitory factor receptor n=1 Tax=Anomaloglossus baeobatrachus TaxID=238106 RepID=UPI003F4FE74C
MWSVVGVVSVLAALQCLLLQVCGQASDFFLNLDCLTHDFETLSCRWDTPLPPDQKITYKVCSRSGIAAECFYTTGNQLEVEFPVFSESDISIEAKDVPGSPSIRFQKTSFHIPYVPYPPEIHSLVADYQSDLLSVDWTVNSTSMLDGVKLTCEMNVLRGGNLLAVNETVEEDWSPHVGMFHWEWKSDFPLNCTSHSVRVRCFVHEEHYNGEKRLSDWSATRSVNGSSDEGDDDGRVFPEDITVPVGSDVNYCCKLRSGNQIKSIKFKSGEDQYPLVDLGNDVAGIRLQNLPMSHPSGDNIFCNTQESPYITGTVVFVGYPPDKPRDFSCEARHLTVINCTWKAGRDTGLYGVDRGTKYTLYERFSGVNTSCSGFREDQEEFNCSYDIKKEQELHEFLLLAANPLGTSNASFTINVTQRLHPLPVDKLLISDSSAREVYLSWVLPGTYTSVNLLCEVDVRPLLGEPQTRNFTLKGLNKDSYYSCEINNLLPYHVYDFRVRCASYDHFWKWSDWKNPKRHRTRPAAPLKKLDIWRENLWNPRGHEVRVYWKHFTIREANGVVTAYRVTWRPLHGADTSPEEAQVSADLNRSSIILTDEQDYEITVQAINDAGSSPPSRITTVLLPSDVAVEQIDGGGNGINVTWSREPNASCGYLVKWIPSGHPSDSSLMWKRFSPNSASGFISSKLFQPGQKYNVSLYCCKNDDYQLLKEILVYSEELAPLVAPNLTIQETTSSSVLVKWEAIAEENLRGFLQGYLFFVEKQQNNSDPERKMKNITDPAVRVLKIQDLQSGTSYTLGLQAYTNGGIGPMKYFSVLTNDNAVGIILAILIPIVIAVLLVIVTSAICYKKREWIKETFYPEIPNPENSKALQFPKNVPEGSKTIKTLEMNRCTPSSVEVVEPFPKILDTELNSPLSDSGQTPDDCSGTPDDNHSGVIYSQPTIHGDTSNPILDGSASPSVVYIDVQSMYQPQAGSEEELDVDVADGAGYKPQMQLPITTVNVDHQMPTEDDMAESSGYRPQGHPNTWAGDSPGSPTSMGSENASFGSPCSVNSRHFLIPPVDNKDSLKPAHAGWSISSLFQNKQEE